MSAVAVSPLDVTSRALIDHLNSRRAATSPPDWNGVDWEAMWELASAERVAPLLYHTNRRNDLLPKWLVDRCRSEYVETGAHNALRMRELAGVLSELSNHGIEVIVLKGAALVEQVYQNLGLRPMLDIDLLVRRHDIRAALAVVESLGYERRGDEISPGSTITYENEIPLFRRERLDWNLELHWSLFDSPYYQRHLTGMDLWETAQRIYIDGSPALSLSPEMQILYLCGHLTLHHRGRGLLWWNDIAECIHHFQDQLDWNEMLAMAQTFHLVRSLQVTLPTVADVWTDAVPPHVIARLRLLTADPDEIRTFEAMTADFRPPARRLLMDLYGMSTWRERLQFIYHNLFPSAAYMDERYGITSPVMRFVYYPYRWAKGVAEIVAVKLP